MKIRSITKRFDSLTALDDISAEFGKGRLCILAGPNGAGKTTLLRIMAGLMPATRGSIDRSPSSLGVMMQESFLYPDLSPVKNLELYAGLLRVGMEKVDELITLLDMEDFARREVMHLSFGQKKRVSLARVLLSDPKCLLLDEPFLGLDAAHVEKLQKIISTLTSSGSLVLIATHELDLVRALADDLLLLDAGRLTYFGSFSSWFPGAPS